MTKKIPVTPELQEELHDFAKGLGATYDAAIRLLLKETIGNENRKQAGHRMRGKIDPDFIYRPEHDMESRK